MTSPDLTNTLAIQGGTPSITHPLPPMYPGGLRIDEEEEREVLEVLRTKRLFRYYGPEQGPSKVAELEERFAKHIGTRYSLAVTSGTGALFCALVGLGIGPGDEVIVPAYTWIASASAVFAVGAVPVVAEVDDSLTLDPADVEAKISPYTRAILPVHMRGAPSNMDALMALARRHNLRVLEDAAQATGASFAGHRLGSIGDAGAYSLQFNKIITSGEGGMFVTDDREVYERAVMVHDVVGGQRNQVPPERTIPGVNFRMPELLGAVGLVQLRRLDALLEAMRARKTMLKQNIVALAASKGVTFRTIHDPAGEAALAVVMFMPDPACAAEVSAALRAEGLNAMVLYSPDVVDYHIYPHWVPLMAQRGWTPNGGPWRSHPRKVEYTNEMCPRSLELLGRAVHFDVSPELTNTQVEELSEALHKVFGALL